MVGARLPRSQVAGFIVSRFIGAAVVAGCGGLAAEFNIEIDISRATRGNYR